MQALIFNGSQLVYTADHPEPNLATGEVLIEPLCMGVCSTDIEICRGYMGFRGVLGHEFVGRVVETGPEADRQWLGRRVVGTINCACGRCDFCQAGIAEHCRDRTVLGILGRDGCFAQRFALPAANLLTVPESITDSQAVFTEPLAAAFEILEQVPITASTRVTVLGDGRLGLLCTQVLNQHSQQVQLVGKHPAKLDLAAGWTTRRLLVEQVAAQADQDVVVDCTGSPTGLGLAMQLVRPRGTIVMKTTAAAQADMPVDLAQLVIHEITLVGSRCGPFPRALKALASGQIDVTCLISGRCSLRDGVQALQQAKAGQAIKLLLTVDG